MNHNCDRRKEENSLLDKSDKSIIFIKSYIIETLVKMKFLLLHLRIQLLPEVGYWW